ncbi:UNVERIFIED_CONTAM: AT-hook motif nuclear-localized protein 19 [Sesamum angustifolium]|uniref:AT-hook motif nuclear-localized protein 19 n=1 Tax=Sesamum angustifolium TaxID=2727405 RepID=A0AAW2LDE0_9LAMI
MANRWWTGGVGLPAAGVDSSSSSPAQRKPDLGISMNENIMNRPISSSSFKNPDLSISMNDNIKSSGEGEEEDEREPSDEPKEGAIEVPTRRPRGRPAGSKNKPKPPIFVTATALMPCGAMFWRWRTVPMWRNPSRSSREEGREGFACSAQMEQ